MWEFILYSLCLKKKSTSRFHKNYPVKESVDEFLDWSRTEHKTKIILQSPPHILGWRIEGVKLHVSNKKWTKTTSEMEIKGQGWVPSNVVLSHQRFEQNSYFIYLYQI